MRVSIPLPIRLLPLLAMAGVCSRATAQFEPVVSNLAPTATTTISNTPVTTLSTDLLTPTRPFVFDETGANILATALTPEVDASERVYAVSETDTALRDSAQTGHVNPYALAGSTLGLSFMANSTPSNSPMTGRMSASQGQAGSASDSSQQTSPAEDDLSTWGKSAAFNNRPLGRSGTGGMSGTDSNTGFGTTSQYESRNAEPAGSSLSANPSGNDSTASLRSSRKRLQANRLSPGIMRQPGSPASIGTQDGSSRDSGPSQNAATASTNETTNGRSARAQDSASFSLFSRPSPEFRFGASPFSPPGGNGDLSFLNPDILRPSSFSGNKSARRDPARSISTQTGLRSQNRAGALQTSASDYGLAPRPPSLHSSSSPSSGRRHKNPYLETSPPGLNR